MARIQIPIHPLTRDSFRPYGDVIQAADSRHYTINQGWAERYADMARLDLLEEGGAPARRPRIAGCGLNALARAVIVEREVAPGVRESECNRPPHSAAGSGYQRPPAGQVHG